MSSLSMTTYCSSFFACRLLPFSMRQHNGASTGFLPLRRHEGRTQNPILSKTKLTANMSSSMAVRCENPSTDVDVLAKLIDGKVIAQDIREKIAAEIVRMKDAINIVPGLAAILVGDLKDSATYVRNKKKACKSVGIKFYEVKLLKNATEEEVLKYISDFNNNPEVHGILVQLPLPSHINKQHIINAIRIEKDVDGFHPFNMDCLKKGDKEPLYIPCTPKGCIELLHRSKVEIKGKRAVVIGQSNTVGKPATILLKREGAEKVDAVDYKTENPREITRQADIIIVAVGKPNLVKGSWIKPGAVILDVGINSVEDADSPQGTRLVGDVCFDEARKVASAISPVPGGVGPMTVAMVLSNTLLSAKRAHNFK